MQQIQASPSAQAMGQLLIRDGLTGLYNRRYLQLRLQREVEVAGVQQQPFCLLVMDLNGFKKTNDTLGHAAGDRLLAETAHTISDHLPGDGVACRYGGDEFVVALPGWTDQKGQSWAHGLLAKMNHVEIQFDSGQSTTGISVSIGIAVCPADAPDYAGLFSLADQAMYHAKHHQQGGLCSVSDLKLSERTQVDLRTGWLAPSVGRESERTLLDAAANAGGEIICIVGSPGSGKSRLATEMLGRVGQKGWNHLLAFGGEPGPLGGLHHLLCCLQQHPLLGLAADQAVTHLSSREQALLETVTSRVAPSAHYTHYTKAAAHLLCLIAAQHPIWLLIEDLHTWDESSQHLIRYLSAIGMPTGLCLVATFTPSGAPDLVDHLRRMAKERLQVKVLDLHPLPEQETTGLVGLILPGEIDPGMILTLSQRSGGLPLAIHTFLQLWVETGHLINATGYWALMPILATNTGSTLHEALAQRALALTGEVRELIEALSVSARPWRLEQICRLCGTTAAEVTPWLMEAERQQILIKREGIYRFANDLTRLIIGNQMGPTARRAWHRVTAQVFEQEAVHRPAELAEQWELGHDLTKAVTYHAQAGETAQSLWALRDAGHHFRKAAELASGLPAFQSQRDRWWQQAGECLRVAGESDNALLCLKRALNPRASLEEAAAALDRLAETCIWAGRFLDGEGYLLEALRILKGAPPCPALVNVLQHRAQAVGGSVSDFDQAFALTKESIAMARKIGLSPHSPAATEIAVAACERIGQRGEALRWIRRAWAAPHLTPTDRVRLTCRLAWLQADGRRRAQLLQLARSEGEQHALAGELFAVYHSLTQTLDGLGRSEETDAVCHAHQTAAWHLGTLGDLVESLVSQGLVAIRHGRLPQAAEILNRCRSLAGRDPAGVTATACSVLAAQFSLVQGEAGQAIDQISASLSEPLAAGMLAVMQCLLLAEAYCDQGQHSLAAEWIVRGGRVQFGTAAWPYMGWTLWLRGRLAEEQGEYEQALGYFADVEKAIHQPYERIKAWIAEARLRRKHAIGDQSTCNHLVRKAQRLAKRLDYPLLIHEAKKLLISQSRPLHHGH